MKQKPFKLLPFHTDPAAVGYQIDGEVRRLNSQLAMDYVLRGPLEKLSIRPPAAIPARKDRLWEETCFECFIGTEKAGSYWEINLSPAGHWNVYSFDDYRSGMKREMAFTNLPIQVDRIANRLNLTCNIALDEVGLSQQPIIMAVSAVLKSVEEDVSYWAQSHPGAQPDFHHRDGFVLKL